MKVRNSDSHSRVVLAIHNRRNRVVRRVDPDTPRKIVRHADRKMKAIRVETKVAAVKRAATRVVVKLAAIRAVETRVAIRATRVARARVDIRHRVGLGTATIRNNNKPLRANTDHHADRMPVGRVETKPVATFPVVPVPVAQVDQSTTPDRRNPSERP